jgi:hypothetical protein
MALALLGAPRAGGAAPAGPSSPQRPVAADEGATKSAVIVMVGAAADSAELAGVLRDLLQGQQIDVRFLRQEGLSTAQLLAGKGDRAVWIFVELRGQREAALYFRGPKARRYLLRRLELRDGLDEIGREVIAQVVESSVQSLLRSSEGMTRKEMRAALARDRAAPSRTPAAPPVDATTSPSPAVVSPPDAAIPSGAAATPPPAPPHAAPATTPAATIAASPGAGPKAGGGRWSAWVGGRYTYSWGGPDLGAGQGPGLEIGVQRRGALLLGARITGERWFTQSVPTTNVDTTVQSSPAFLLLDVGWPISPSRSLSAGVGGGVDITRVAPGMVYDPAIAAAPPQQHVSPVLRGELRYEMGGASWRLAAVLLIDTSIYATHYDVDRGATTERAATPWRFRPGGALVLGWCPSSAPR